MKWLLLILGFLAFHATAQDTTLFFKSIGTENGLSHNKVNCVLQDRKGFIWIGTEDGLNRYDGRYVAIFKNKLNDTTSISGNIIKDLYQDKQGVIWIATADGGLTRFDQRLPPVRQFKQYKYTRRHPLGIPENAILKIVEDRYQHLWLATSKSFVVRFNKLTGKFDTPVKTGTKGILSLLIDKDTLLVGREGGGLLKVNTRTLQYQQDVRYANLYAKVPHASVTSIFLDSKRNLWLGNWDNKLYRYTGGQYFNTELQPNSPPPGSPQDDFVCFAEDKANRIWMAGLKTGLTVFNPANGKFYNYKNNPLTEGTLVNNNLNCIYIDRAGMAWVGTNNGLSIYNPLFVPFVKRYLPKLNKDITLYDFYKDKTNRLWIGTSEGIFIKEAGSETYQHRKLTYKGDPLAVTKFYIDKDSTFYLGTDYTLFKYNALANTISPLPNTDKDPVMHKLINSRIVSIVRDTLGSHPVLIISPYGHYMCYYDLVDKKWISRADKEKLIIKKFDLRDNLIRKFYQDKNGRLWMATSKAGLGLSPNNDTFPLRYYDNESSAKNTVSSNNIYDLKEDRTGNLWISTYGGGLNYLEQNANQFTHIPESSNLTEGIELDHTGKIWMVVNGHLHTYNPTTSLYNCYDLPYMKKNGGVKGYIYKDKQNSFYAAGTNCYLEFNPEQITTINNEPQVYLTDFKVFNESFSNLLEQKSIELNHSQNYFSFEFSAPDFSGDNIQYSYMLEGVDKNWIDAGKRNTATYANLPGGKYLFKVKANNWKGNKVNKFTTAQININPPFWLRWWFYALLVAAFLTLIYLIYSYRLKEIYKHQAIRNGIAQDLHDHVGSTLSSILVYSGVANSYLEQNKTQQLTSVLNSIGDIAGEMITEMGDIVWAINPKNDNLQSIIQRITSYAQPLCVAKDIAFFIKSDSRVTLINLEMQARKNLFLILKEAINNAIKYSQCRFLTVTVDYYNNKLHLKIEDDGIGFSLEVVNSNSAQSLSGNGIHNMKTRAEELNAQFEIKSEPAKGTKIMLSFPSN